MKPCELKFFAIIIFQLITTYFPGIQARYTSDYECYNLDTPETNISRLLPTMSTCIKLWTMENCRYQLDIGSSDGEIIRSVSGCLKCNGKQHCNTVRNSGCIRQNGEIGYQCRGSGTLHPCIPRRRTGNSAKDCPSDTSKDVPMVMEHMDMTDFKVFNPNTDSDNQQPSIAIIVYKRSDPANPMDAMTVELGANDKVVVYIHGYATNYIDDGAKMKNALFLGTEDVDAVLLVDWRKWSVPGYRSWSVWPWNYQTVAIENVPRVAEQVANFLRTKLTNDQFIYIIGHSLGAQIAGTAARLVAKDGLIVDRITALDPAGPIFEHTFNLLFNVFNENTLRSTDAKFVDVIHTSTQLGMIEPAGHLDTYLIQNDCISPICTHAKAVDLYISSLTKCSLITCPASGPCTSETVSDFGYLSDLYKGRGEYILTIETRSWWESTGWDDKLCSEFQNVYLPAKDRICHSPPMVDINTSRNCKDKPYLSECEMMCPINGMITTGVCSTSSNAKLPMTEQRRVSRFGHVHKRTAKVKWFVRGCNESL